MLTLTLTGIISILTASYFPALDLSNDEYELGLTNFKTYNAIPNVTSANNKFCFDTDDKIITIPEGYVGCWKSFCNLVLSVAPTFCYYHIRKIRHF
ncbi:hypothetical protein ALC56_04112 [Trachymyrmex septentrionalis]|uniref:Uncharacterized protein n=1 Tax=Trachymyrmex septentrionalis TaxID=34720 RepID=A0A151JYK9_9HYME|nr:hypothetical protein ALC56_04112 [Trachymyrmex septentrionalis]